MSLVSSASRAPGPDAATILAAVGSVVYEWSLGSDALAWGPNLTEVLGVTPADVAHGRAFARLMTIDSPRGRYETIVNSGEVDRGEGVAYEVEYALAVGPGRVLWVEDAGRWEAGADGRPRVARGVVRVVNERHEHVRKLTEASEIDVLTGQISRTRFIAMLEDALVDAAKVRASVGLLVVAIDNLSRVNEAYGFETADEVIASVARRLRARMRGGDILGRLSGNKFGVLMRNCVAEDITVAAERMVSSVGDDVFQTSVGPISVSVTVGGVVGPRHAQTTAQMLARAQEALDGVKVKRRGAFALYQPNLEREAKRRENMRVTDEIVAALNDRRVALAYQPIVSANGTRDEKHYECLARIRREDGSLVSAGAVVPFAEKLGLVRLIDMRVLELATAELIADQDVRLSVNVSPTTTMDREWLASLSSYLRYHSGIAERLMIEITETAAIASLEETRSFVARIKDLGAKVAIDDFGAGYTSFRNLRRLDVDCVKIDGAFVANFDRCEDDRHFVETLLGLAKHMKLATVAEWVQNEAVARELHQLGCDFLQGSHTGSASEARPWRDVVAARAA